MEGGEVWAPAKGKGLQRESRTTREIPVASAPWQHLRKGHKINIQGRARPLRGRGGQAALGEQALPHRSVQAAHPQHDGEGGSHTTNSSGGSAPQEGTAAEKRVHQRGRPPGAQGGHRGSRAPGPTAAATPATRAKPPRTVSLVQLSMEAPPCRAEAASPRGPWPQNRQKNRWAG